MSSFNFSFVLHALILTLNFVLHLALSTSTMSKKTLATFGQSSTTEQRRPRRSVDFQLRHQGWRATGNLSHRYRQSLIDIGWTEEHCARWDKIAAEDHSFFATAAERIRRENTQVLVLNISGLNGSMNQGEDYQAKRINERKYQVFGKS